MELDRGQVDLSNEVDAITDEFRPQAEEADVDCRIETNAPQSRRRPMRAGSKSPSAT